MYTPEIFYLKGVGRLREQYTVRSHTFTEKFVISKITTPPQQWLDHVQEWVTGVSRRVQSENSQM